MAADVERVYPAGQVALREVGLRDGLQLTKAFPSTAAKSDWIRREHAAGVRHFEVGSFLPASRFPHCDSAFMTSAGIQYLIASQDIQTSGVCV